MPEPLENCPVCHGKSFRFRPTDRDGVNVGCGYCGEFFITGSVLPKLVSLDLTDRKKIYQWLYDQQLLREKPEIDSYNLPIILTYSLKTFSEITNQILLYLDSVTVEFGQQVQIATPKLTQATGTFDWSSSDRIIRSLSEMKLLQITGDLDKCFLTPDGYERIEKIKQPSSQGSQGFVAMWFDPSMESAWTNGFEQAIRNCGYDPRRIDKKEHINKICDEIVSEIRKSRFVVADFTGDRGGVYYEAGFGYGLGMPIINTCRKDWMEKLHFDIRQYNCIDWVSEAELSERLQKRIEAAVGMGPKRLN